MSSINNRFDLELGDPTLITVIGRKATETFSDNRKSWGSKCQQAGQIGSV